MHSRGTHATLAVPLVESNREEDIRRLRAAIGDHRVVEGPLKVGILQIYVGYAMTGGRQVDQPSSGTDQWRNPVDEDKVTEMICAELRFKAVHRVAERSGH